MPEYEIRPHHCFNKWVLVFRNGQSIRAFTNKGEAQDYITRQKRIDDFKKREIKL